jgi:hypothetical protein
MTLMKYEYIRGVEPVLYFWVAFAQCRYLTRQKIQTGTFQKYRFYAYLPMGINKKNLCLYFWGTCTNTPSPHAPAKQLTLVPRVSRQKIANLAMESKIKVTNFNVTVEVPKLLNPFKQLLVKGPFQEKKKMDLHYLVYLGYGASKGRSWRFLISWNAVVSELAGVLHFLHHYCYILNTHNTQYVMF